MQVALLLILTACGASDPTSAQPGDERRPFTVTDVATFDDPWAMAFLPGSTEALVTEKPGHLWLVDVATGRKREIAGAPAVVYTSQGGLLDVAIAPGFARDRQVYLTFAKPDSSGGSSLALGLGKLVEDAGGARLESLRIIWSDPAGGKGGQFGGRIAFAPDRKSLFLVVGERQRFTPAQDPSQPLGKILHLKLDGRPAPGNPMAGKLGSSTVTITDPPRDTEAAKSAAGRTLRWPGANLTPAEIWTSGHRNPYGLMFAPDGRLWEAEAGPNGGDELNLIEKGANYGWPVVSEGDNYDGVPIPRQATHHEFVAPKLIWTPTITPGGLLIYTGDKFPKWKGDALIPGLNGQTLIRVHLDGAKAARADRWDMGHRMRGIAQGPDGAVYLLEDDPGAKLLRLEPVP